MNRSIANAGSTAYGLPEVSVTRSPGRLCSAILRAASTASESMGTMGNFSSRSSARTRTPYFAKCLGDHDVPVLPTRVGLTEGEVAHPQITDGKCKRDRGHHRPPFGEVPEGDGMAGALRDPDRDDIRAGSDGGEVATEDGASSRAHHSTPEPVCVGAKTGRPN